MHSSVFLAANLDALKDIISKYGQITQWLVHSSSRLPSHSLIQ